MSSKSSTMTAQDKRTQLNTTPEAERGVACYNSWIMLVYDWLVLGFINSFAWRCSTKRDLLPLFKNNIRSKHVDIGVGTGYYLKEANVPCSVKLTLCDLSENALRVAKARCGRPDATELLWDITNPFPAEQQWDSISLFYVLHCMPGPARRKTVVFDNLAKVLTDDGVLTGCTVLGKGIKDNFIGKIVRKHCLDDGVFDNRDDDVETFLRALEKNFDHVEAKVVGVSLIFRATGPKR